MTHPLVTAARAYLGVPFRHRGRSSHALDCAGLGWLAFRDLGIALPDLRHYGREPFRDGLMTALTAALGPPVDGPPSPQEGDIAVFALVVGGSPHHVALIGLAPYTDNGRPVLTMIHADSSVRQVVEQRLDAWWTDRLCAVYRRAAWPA